jgi:hypothetical protein
MEKNKETLTQQAIAYLKKTSKHLFQTSDRYYYKVEVFERDNKYYKAIIFMGNGKVILNVSEVISEQDYSNYGNNVLNVLQQGLFPAYNKTEAVPYFKKMRSIIKYLMAEIQISNTSNKDLVEKLKSRLPELEISK